MTKEAQSMDREAKLCKFKALARQANSAEALDANLNTSVLVCMLPIFKSEQKKKAASLVAKNISNYLRKCNIQVEENMQVTLFDDGENTKDYCILTFDSAYLAEESARCIYGFEHQPGKVFYAWTLLDFKEYLVRDCSTKRVFYDEVTTKRRTSALQTRWFSKYRDSSRQFLIHAAKPCIVQEIELDHMQSRELFNIERCEQLKHLAHAKTNSNGKPFSWSTQGTYLVIQSANQLALVAGDNFDFQTAIIHKHLTDFIFSPQETYVLTHDNRDSTKASPTAYQIHMVCPGYAVSTVLRTFPVPAEIVYEVPQSLRGTGAPRRDSRFPHFTFSHDDKYIATIKKDALYMYHLPQCALILSHDRTVSPLRFERIQRVEWGPRGSIVGVWCGSHQDGLGRFSLVEIPTLKEIVSRHITNVQEASLDWQSSGDFLCVRTRCFERVSKIKIVKTIHLEIVRLKEKNVPVDSISLKKWNVRQLHWEGGVRNRIALILHDEVENTQEIHFYCVFDGPTGKGTLFVEKLELNEKMNLMCWCPTGLFFIVAEKSSAGAIHLYILNEDNRVQFIKKTEHENLNEIKCSPCGRFFASCSTLASGDQYEQKMNAKYMIWNYHGKLLFPMRVNELRDFEWRPQFNSIWSLLLKCTPSKMNERIKTLQEEEETHFTEAKRALISNRLKKIEELNRELMQVRENVKDDPDYIAFQRDVATHEASIAYDIKTCVEDEIVEKYTVPV